MVKTHNRLRFALPLYAVAEGARIVGVRASILATRARGYLRRSDGQAYVAGDRIITYPRTASTGISKDTVRLPLAVSEPT